MKHILVLLSLGINILFLNFLHAQENAPVTASLNTHYGFILPHSKVIHPLSHSNPYGLEFSLGKLHTSEKAYQQCNCYSKTGIALSWFNFDNPSQLGHAINIAPYVEALPVYENKLSVSFRALAGFSYVTKVYDEQSNPDNYFFSTPISFILGASSKINYRINNSISLHGNINFNHISNGGIKDPNKGMNFPTAAVNIQYTINPMDDKGVPDDYTGKSLRDTNILRIGSFISGKMKPDTDLYNREFCWIYGIWGFAGRRILPQLSIVGGFEWIRDGYEKEGYSRQNIDKPYNKLSLLSGIDFNFGNFIFSIKCGAYLYPNGFQDDFLYQKYDLMYNLYDNFKIGVYLNAHANVADFMGFSTGFRVL